MSKKSFSNSSRPVVVADDAIPFLEGVLEPWCTVRYIKGSQIGPSDVRDASALLVRTRTKCGAALLSGSSVRLVATATIGTDHIDIPWCETHGIEVVSAPGCNAGGVRQWVFAALRALGVLAMPSRPTLGVVGVGHVGSLIVETAKDLGFNVLCNDVITRASYVPLDYLLANSDIVTLHIPKENNINFADAEFFAKMKPGAVFLNASRGEVVDDEALLAARKRLSALALDVWRGEPDINLKLLAAADIATPHIAGYSFQGKVNGTAAVLKATSRCLGLPELSPALPAEFPPVVPYDIKHDDAALRASTKDFETLRSHYFYRDDSLF